MGKFKKRLSSMLAVVLTAFTFLSSVPVKATEITPNVTFVGVEHSPLVVGDSETFYLSAMGAEKVQYRVFQNKIGTDKWEELTKGYTLAEDANAITPVNGLTKYEVGKYKLSIWVKKADTEGKYKNKTGSYDSYYITYLNCVNKDNNNRVYTNGDMNVEKDNYVVGETVKVSGIKDISGMKDPYTYKLHIYDVNSNEWKLDKGAYRKDLSFVPDKPGTYVLDVWAMSSNSTLWAKETKLNGRIYEAWKLKVITVTEKVEEPEVNIVENGVIFGSQDANNPMQINKNVNIIAKNVAFNNVNVKGNVTVTGDYTTLNNVKVEGTLILNPGENGTVNLNNVNANTIEVLSGAANSIHFNNVNAKALNVNSKNVKEIVRVELKGATNIEKTTIKSNAILEIVKGSFGNIEILENSTKTEDFVEFRGSFDKNITVKTKATLKTAKDAKILKVIIEPENNEKITLDGNFGQIEVNKKAVVAIAENTKIEKITTNTSGVTLETGKGSIVTTLDQNGQTVTQTGTGTVENKINPPVVVVPPVTQPTYYSVTGVTISPTTANMVNGAVMNLTATVSPSNANNKNLTWASSATSVATVDAAGKVTAVGIGTATITATSVDNNTIKASCVITVKGNSTDLGVTVTTNMSLVTVALDNPLAANKAIAITIFNKSDNALVFIDQINKANVSGKANFYTTLDAGNYYGFLNVADANLFTRFDFTVGQTTVDALVENLIKFANEQAKLNEYMTIGNYQKPAGSRSLDITINKDASLEELFNLKNTVSPTMDELMAVAGLAISLQKLDMKVNNVTLASYLQTKLNETEYKDYTTAQFVSLFMNMDYTGFVSLFNSMATYNEPVDVVLEGKAITSITIDTIKNTGATVEIYNNVNNKRITRENIRTAFGLANNESLSNMKLSDFKGIYVITKADGATFTINVK